MTDDQAREIAEDFAAMPQHLPLIRALRLVSEPVAWSTERRPPTVVVVSESEGALYVLVANDAHHEGDVEVTTRRRPIHASATRIEVAGPRDEEGPDGPGLARTWRFYFEGEPEPIELHGFEQLDFTEPVAHSPRELVARAIARLAGWKIASLPPTRQ